MAHVRVSTGGRALDSQRLAILDYAHRQGLTVDTFIEPHTSARRPRGARGLDTRLEQLDPGNVLLASEISRLGRRVGQIIQFVNRLIPQRVRLITIKGTIQINSTQDMQTNVMVTLWSLFAGIEQELIAERSKAGLAAARAKGRLPGRPKGVRGTSQLTGHEAEMQLFLANMVSQAAIAKILGLFRSTFPHFIQSKRLG